MKRGEVYLADISPRSGAEQRGRRPIIILSHNGFNATKTWRSIIIVPLSTSAKQAKRGPTAIPISAGEGGLQQDSIALCHQITTLDKQKLVRKLGRLSAETIKQVEQGIKIALHIRS